MNGQSTYRLVERLRHPLVMALLAVAAVFELLLNQGDDHVQLTFGLLVTLLMPGLLTRGDRIGTFLSAKPIRYVGTRAYGIYLFHPLIGEIVGRGMAEGQALPFQLIRYALIFGISLLVADILFRVVEKPMIAMGRKLTATSTTQPTIPAP